MVKLTNKVRRGLALAHALIQQALSGDGEDPRKVAADFRASQTSDFNQALAWLDFQAGLLYKDQQSEDLEKDPPQEPPFEPQVISHPATE